MERTARRHRISQHHSSIPTYRRANIRRTLDLFRVCLSRTTLPVKVSLHSKQAMAVTPHIARESDRLSRVPAQSTQTRQQLVPTWGGMGPVIFHSFPSQVTTRA